MEFSTTPKEYTQKELQEMRDENEKTLYDYYHHRLIYWDFYNVKNNNQ
jgi:hypothetical protein